MNRIIIAAVLATVGASVTQAQGAAWLSDRSRAQGPGFRLGNLELHPGFGAEVGYDSNVFFEDSDEGPLEPAGSVVFRLTPHLFLSTLTDQRTEEGESQGEGQTPRMVQFQAGVSAEAYFFLEDQARNNVALNGNLDLSINPKGRFGFRIFDNFQRTVRPFTGRTDERSRNYAIDTNTVGANITGRSRGGLLELSLGYAFRLQYFEGNDFQYANQFGHRIFANTHYRFFPSTSLFWDATVDFANYYNNDDAGAALALADNTRIRTRIGLNGVITPKLNATAAIGYTATFVDNPLFSDFDSVLALVGLKFRLTPAATLGFGYERENVGSIVGLYRTQDRGYLDFQWLFARSFLLALNTWVARMDFGEIFDATGTSLGNRDDIFFSVRLFAEYRFTDYLALNLSFAYTGDFTDFEYQLTTMAGTIPDPAGFNKVEAWLGVRVFY